MRESQANNFAEPSGKGRFRFSILHLAYAIALIAFALAASRDEEYAFSALLRSTCVGILIFGLASQSLDLWKARSQWNSATWEERNGWRLAIIVRCLVIGGLLYSSFATVEMWLYSRDPDDSEFNLRVEAVSNAFEPMMLICGFSFAPWCWGRASATWKRVVDGVIALLALSALLAVTWYGASFMTSMIHVAIHGASLAEPIHLDTISPARTPDLIQFTHVASMRAGLALGLGIAAAFALYARSRVAKLWMQIPLWALAAISVAASMSQILWLKQVAFPRISPLLAEGVAKMEPRLEGTIAGACLFIGALAILWMEIGRSPLSSRRWRPEGWYLHETRFFYELLVFSIVVENVEVFHQVMGIFSEIGSLLGGNFSGLFVSVMGVISGFFYEPLQMAILLLSLGGLFQRRKTTPSELDQTPAPASPLALILGTPIVALCAYLIAESMLWSNFFYWITAT